jgi:hypothetical protein
MAFMFTTQIFATTWSDLELKKDYTLNQGFELPQLERSGSRLVLSQGETFELKKIEPLELSIPVTLMIFSYPQCPGMEMKTSMELIRVQKSEVEVGAVVQDCELLIYLETKDLNSKSLFL